MGMRRGPPMRRPLILPFMLATAALAGVAVYVIPHGLAAHALLVTDDPVKIADHTLAKTFDGTRATQEIELALAAKDTDLARSFVDLAAERNVSLEPTLIERVNAAVVESNSAVHVAQSFARGLVTGEPQDGASLAGTALGDLFVFGDVRDALREGSRMALGQPVDKLILGLATAGLAVTGVTYATFGAGAPVRAGLSLVKAARKTGRFDMRLARAVAREMPKTERVSGLVQLARDVGRVEAKAGARAALDGLQVAETPRALSRVAKLAEKEGSSTRAILKTAGRGAIWIGAAAFDLALWILGALLSALAFVAALKGFVERVTLRIVRHRKARRHARSVMAAVSAM
jgi:hypothetical protein